MDSTPPPDLSFSLLHSGLAPASGPVTAAQLTPEDLEIREDLLATPTEELVQLILNLRAELTVLRAEAKDFKRQKDRVVQARRHLAETLSAIDSITETVSAADTTTVTQSTSALPSKIDNDWSETCATNPHWRQWWQSGRARPLRKVTYLPENGEGVNTPLPSGRNQQSAPHPTSNPAPASNTTAPTPTASQDQGNSGDSAHAPCTPPTNYLRRRRRSGRSGRNNTFTTHSNNNNSSSGTNYTGNNNSGGRTRTPSLPHCGRCLQRGHTPGSCTAVVCDFCGRRGHLADYCRTRQAEERRRLQCDYCLRGGHTAESCFTRATEARQERLFRAILSERLLHAPPPSPPTAAPPQVPGPASRLPWVGPAAAFHHVPAYQH